MKQLNNDDQVTTVTEAEPGYVLGSSDAERQRLVRQAQAYSPEAS